VNEIRKLGCGHVMENVVQLVKNVHGGGSCSFARPLKDQYHYLRKEDGLLTDQDRNKGGKPPK